MTGLENFNVCRLYTERPIYIYIYIYILSTAYKPSPSYDHINLVDPASSHTLVLKIKPCMSK